MAGEKLRTLAQRQRGTDLSDCVLLEQLANGELQHLPRVREEKFTLVCYGLVPTISRHASTTCGRVTKRTFAPSIPTYPTTAQHKPPRCDSSAPRGPFDDTDENARRDRGAVALTL
jgi:hypothetical protein